MKLLFLPNLASKSTKATEINPGDDITLPVLPTFKSKDDYRHWCNLADTEHVFYSLVEGLTTGLRVSEGNPAWIMHGLVAEYDAQQPEDWRRVIEANATVRPTWATRTFSGHMRLIWAFETPVPCPANPRFLKEFYKAAWIALKAKRLGSGFEAEESSLSTQYFEIGRDWVQLGEALPAVKTEAWQVAVCNKIDWSSEAQALPVDKVRAKLQARYPGALEWSHFEVGTRCHRFWEPGADAASVIVTPVGLKCFTGDKAFLFWDAPELLGAAGAKELAQDVIGAAVKDIFYCPPAGKYYTESKVAGLQPWGKEDIRLRLVQRGLSSSTVRGKTLSDVEEALLAIQDMHTVDGVFPAFCRPEKLVRVNGLVFLNTSRAHLTQPLPGKVAWGEGFPWIADFIPKMFGKQADVYLTWLAHFYQSCLLGRPVRGLALFIAGPRNCGKTCLNNAIHKQLFGTAQEATKYLTGEDQFNSQLFGSPIWTVDDAVANSDARTRTRFSQAVKAIAANDEFTMRGMYKEGVRMPWVGRLIVTMNDDPESLQMLPSTEGNLLDKICLIRAYPTFYEFPTDEEIAEELPAFGAWLRDMDRREGLWVGGRFGVAPYHDPELVQTAEDSQDSTSTQELVIAWAREYFDAEENAGKESWEGNPTELLLAMCENDRRQAIVTKLLPNAVWVGRQVNKLVLRGEKWITREGRNLKILSKALPTRISRR